MIRRNRMPALSTLALFACGCAWLPGAFAQSQAESAVVRGIRLLQGRQFAAAKAQFTDAVKANPASSDALTWRGICENQLKQYREASADFQAALRIDPSAQPAHYNLALSLIRLGEPSAAIHELETVVAANPEAVEAQYNLALLLEANHTLDQAAHHLNEAYARQPNDEGIQQHLLADDLALNNTAQADEILAQLQTSPAAVQAHIGADLAAKGFFAQAARLIESARLGLPSSLGLDLQLARAYVGANEDFKAIELLKGSAQPDPSGQRAYVEGLAYMAAGASQEATDAFRAAIAANPHEASAHYELATLEQRSGDSRALADLREAVRLDPQNISYANSLGKALLEADRAPEALRVLEPALGQGPEEALRYLLLGIAQAATNAVPAAQATLQRAVAMDPSIALAHNLLGFCYFQVGDYAQAASSYQAAADLSPQTARFAYDTALALERLDRAADAESHAEKAVQLDPSSAKNHYLLGKLYGKLDRKPEAIRELETAVRLNPQLDYSYYQLARINLRMGETAKAQEWNLKFQQLKKEQFKLHGVSSMSSAPDEAVSPAALLGGAQMDPESASPTHKSN